MRIWAYVALMLWIALIAYTAVVIANHGANLLPIFFGDMMRINWPGQFNADFMLMLFVSASWTAWRNDFSAKGWGLAVIAFFFGASFLLIYMVWLIHRHSMNPAVILLGERRSGSA